MYKTKAAAVASVNATPTADSSDDNQKSSCRIDQIGWLLCPVINFGANIADGAFNFLKGSFLKVDTQVYDTNSGTYAAWQGLLAFANIFFVIIFLIIIFSQATGFGISNYGIKKMLPKLIIGVILINASYFICQALVDLSNFGGYYLSGMFDNIAKMANSQQGSDFASSGNTFTDIAGAIIAGAAAGAVVIAMIAFFGPVLLAAVVGLLMIFLILIARQAIIVLAIVTAPLAFAAWLLPNTEKLFKQWWSIFSKMLLLFPIISLVFGVSKLLSGILVTAYSNPDTANSFSGSFQQAASIQTDSGANVVGQIMGAAVLVVPLFAVPFLLKGALNAVPVLGNMAQRAYNGATRGTRRQSQDKLNPMFAALGAQKDAGVRGLFGQRRKLDADGNPVKASVRQRYNRFKRGFEDTKASYEKMADANYKDFAQKNAGSLAGSAARRSHVQGDRIALSEAKLKDEHTHEKATAGTYVNRMATEMKDVGGSTENNDKAFNNEYDRSAIADARRVGGPTTQAGRNFQRTSQLTAQSASLGEQSKAYSTERKNTAGTLENYYGQQAKDYGGTAANNELEFENRYNAAANANPTSIAGQNLRQSQVLNKNKENIGKESGILFTREALRNPTGAAGQAVQQSEILGQRQAVLEGELKNEHKQRIATAGTQEAYLDRRQRDIQGTGANLDLQVENAYRGTATTDTTSTAYSNLRQSQVLSGQKAVVDANIDQNLKTRVADTSSDVGQLDIQRRNFADMGTTAQADSDFNWEEARAGANPESQIYTDLQTAGINADSLKQRSDYQKAYAQGRTAAQNVQTSNYTKNLRTDNTLLDTAAGMVSGPDGQAAALAFATKSQAEQEQARVGQARYLGGKNSESFLLHGVTMADNGTDMVYTERDSDGNITRRISTSDPMQALEIDGILRSNNLVSAGQTHRDVSEAVTTALGDIQQFAKTTYGAEATIINAAHQKTLNAEYLQRLVNDSGGTVSEKAQMVERLNAELSNIGGMEDFSYSTVNAQGKIVLGGQKGNLEKVIKGFVDTKGVSGLTKQMLNDESMVMSYEVDPSTGDPIYEDATDAVTGALIVDETGATVQRQKQTPIERRLLAANLAYSKMTNPDQLASFRAGLTGMTDENITLLAKQFARIDTSKTAEDWRTDLAKMKEEARKLK